MKLKNLLYLLLAMPLFVACNPVEEELDPVLTLTSAAEITLGAEGGQGVITYTLENPVTGVEVSATCEAAWVENLTAGATVTFTVGANEGEARETKVVVSYASEKLEVAVKQAAKTATPEPEPEPKPEPEPTGVEFTALMCEGEYYGNEYSDAYNYYTHFSDNGYDEDGYMQASTTYYIFDIYSNVEGVSEGGYITVPAGTYVYDATDSGADGTFGHSYSAYVVVNAAGDGYEVNQAFQSGTLVVTENGATLTAVIAGVTHTMTYEGPVKIADTTASVGPTPGEGGEVEVTLHYGIAEYAGDYYNPGYSDNFYMTLSDVGFDEEGYPVANGKYYRFDVYAPILDGNVEGLPAGTYEMDVDESCDPWTIGAFYGAYYEMDEYGYDYAVVDYPEAGYLTVNEDGTMVAEYTLMMSGEVHKITFDGTVVINDVRDSLGDSGDDDWGDDDWGESEGPYSTLTDDLVLDFSDHTLYYVYYGDYYEVGYRNWVLVLMPNTYEGDYVQFDVLGDENSITSYGGNYVISDSMGAFTSYPGVIEYGYMGGSWYYTSDGYTMAPFVEGTLGVVDNGDGTASIECDFYDDLGYHITGSWSGVAMSGEDLFGAPAQAPAKAAIKAAKAPKQAPAKVVKKESVVAKAQAKASAKKGLSLWK